MVASDVCPTEDAILAFLEYLVDPMLPAKSSVRDTPSQTQQQLVAKQVFAVVLLYNYYHRKQHRQLTFEGFESFCKLSVVQRPALLAHMKLMQRSDDSDLDDPEKQLSLTEKTVMDACDISKSLDASKDVPSTEGWPISKIAVFLVDSRKENCFLQFGSMTQGVWSVIEKDVNVSSCVSEVTVEEKHKKRKIRVTKIPLRDELGADELSFQRLAFSAVQEATGFNQNDLTIMRSDVVYSLSKEKTATRFYMMQSTQPKKDDVIQIPIKDAIDSLQGPLVVRNSRQWMITPVVDYFHLLPYAGIVSDWFSREVLSNDLEDQRLALESINVSSSKKTEEPYEPEIHNNQDGSHISINEVVFLGSSLDIGTKSQETDKNECCMDSLSGGFDEPCSMNVDACSLVCCQNEEKSKNIDTRVQLDDHQTMLNLCLKSDLNGTSGGEMKAEMVDSMRMPCFTESRGENTVNGKATCDANHSDQHEMPIDDCVITHKSNSKDLDKLPNTVASKENILSQAALRVLLSRRDKLTLQLRNLEDEIAVCDKRIQTLLNGGKDDLALRIESILEGCDDTFAQERSRHQCSPLSIRMKRLSEAVLSKQNSCQELDDIAYENNWLLPTYRVSPSDGGFQADVTVKGPDFESSSSGDLRSSPREARESAAAQVLAKLRSMASETK